jgi:hypothetical protein
MNILEESGNISVLVKIVLKEAFERLLKQSKLIGLYFFYSAQVW